ncbi:ArnT family glycosyltransferase [Clostridium akagii]|uniref:ArnT family glycosyltransferase n=1 Tax=Clostridium akagii TaxID=91623 RepID=UPI00047BB9C8|nr:hypothetical protein [Clostridium akagii]
MRKGKEKFKYLTIFIYSLAFLFFVFKMFFYSEYVGRFPDEMQHVAYIAYLEKTNAIIPNFKDMRIFVNNSTAHINYNTELTKNNNTHEYTFGSNLNYLGHPPLYYQIMRLSRAVRINGNTVTVDLFKLRLFNIVISALAMVLILYIGYTRVGKKLILHCLYATIVISVPMLAFCSAGINNDTLSLLALPIFLLGLLRFSEQKRNFRTFFIISLGVFISFMSKLTLGLIVFISMLLYIILIIIKEKSARFLISKKFFATVPVYFITMAYFLIVYFQTGSIQPSYKSLDLQGFLKSGFYVNVADRTHMNFNQYAVYFTKNFLMTWTSIQSHFSLDKIGGVFSINTIAELLLLVIPVILLFQIKRAKRNASIMLVLISVYFALAISVIIQWLRAYSEYTNSSGYLGGFQSRYYLCGIPAIALAVTFIMKNLFEGSSLSDNGNEKKSNLKYNEITNNLSTLCYKTKKNFNLKKFVGYIICCIFICMLFYEDFIYFVIYFKDYL